jgi:hypothetical protein
VRDRPTCSRSRSVEVQARANNKGELERQPLKGSIFSGKRNMLSLKCGWAAVEDPLKPSCDASTESPEGWPALPEAFSSTEGQVLAQDSP